MIDPFKELANHLRELADEMDLDMIRPTIELDLDGTNDVLKLGFIVREPDVFFTQTGDEAFDDLISRLRD